MTTQTRTEVPFKTTTYRMKHPAWLSVVRDNPSKYEQTWLSSPVIQGPSDVHRLLRDRLARQEHESLIVIGVNAVNRILFLQEASRGGIAGTSLFPREVFKVACMANACGIILVHNHPSGSPEPSVEDLALTRKLLEGGQLLGIELLDHLIISGWDSWTSVMESL